MGLHSRGVADNARNRSIAPCWYAANVLPIIREIQRAGATSLRAIADALNARGVATARGGRWQPQTVSNVLARK
jgi:Recombinase